MENYTNGQLFNLVSGSSITGESAYELWKSLGNEGGAAEFLEYLKEDNVDEALSENSENPVQNKVVAKKINEMNKEASTMKQEIAVERARINKFTALEEGSTTGDAELIDARVDYEGKTWDNVGDHIRGVSSQLSEQIDDLENDINDIMIMSSNALNSADLQKDKAIDGAGKIVDNVGTVISPVINITNEYIVVSRKTANDDRQYGTQAISLYKDGAFVKRIRSVVTPYQITDDANQVIVTFYDEGATDYFIGFTPTNEVMEYDEYCKTINPDKIPIINPFNGLTAVAFGTSLTARADWEEAGYTSVTYGYLTYLRQLSGMDIENKGIGGATILSDSETKSIYTQIMNYTDYANKDVCIVEGFVNDWFKNSENTLGTYTDNGTDTVCGRVRNAVSHILTQNPNITIFAILDHYGKNDGTTSHASTQMVNGNTQYSYYEEIAKVFESMGVILIKEYAVSGISELAPQYLVDYIHLNDLGARQSANTIWSAMKQYTPKATN